MPQSSKKTTKQRLIEIEAEIALLREKIAYLESKALISIPPLPVQPYVPPNPPYWPTITKV